MTYSDPFVPELRIDGGEMQAQDLMTSVAAADCTVVVDGSQQHGLRRDAGLGEAGCGYP